MKLHLAVLAAVSAIASSFFASAAGAQTPPLGKPIFCQGEYALCIRAPCTPDVLGDRALCSCEVEHGWSMGPTPCTSRRPAFKNGATTIISTYSNRFNNVDKTLTCTNSETRWAWCYGAPCVVDPNNPKAATCTCPVYTSAMSTLGGSCDHANCDRMWSAATPADDAAANRIFYDYMTANHPSYPVNRPAPACFSKWIAR
jgi:hypothetical protein